MLAGIALLNLYFEIPVLAGGEWVFRSQITRMDVPADALVQITQPSARIDIPRGSNLEYDIFMGEGNVTFGGGVCVVTRKGSVIKEPSLKDAQGIDTHFVRGAAELERLAKGKWLHRKINLETIAGTPATEIFLAVSAGMPRAIGVNEVRFRNIRLTDGNGVELADLMSSGGALPYPLIIGSTYVREVKLEGSVVSGSFDPVKYLVSADQAFAGEVLLRNFDPAAAASVTYSLTIQRIDNGKAVSAPVTGEVNLGPGVEVSVPVKLPALAAGHYRARLSITSNGQESVVESAAISSLSKEQFAARKAPFSRDAFGMGAVSGAGDTPVQTLPLLRELGANYFQLRFDWAQLEPEPGRYDFSLVEPYLKMARRCGLWVQIDLYSGYPAYTVPKWYRGEQMISNTGKTNQPMNCAVAYWTGARQAGLKLLETLAMRYGNNGIVVGWNAWLAGNMDGFYMIRGTPREAGLQDYSASSQVKFRDYVQSVLNVPLEDFSARYGQSIQSWDDLKQPQPRLEEVNLDALWRDFMLYRSWSVEAVEMEATKAIRKYQPKAVVEYLYGGSLSSFGHNGSDFDAGVRNAMTNHGSMHHTASPGAENQVYLGTAQRRLGVPFSIETAGTPASPADHQHALFELLSQGASAYTYIQSRVWGLMTFPKSEYGFGEFRPALERLANALPVGTELAVVFPYSEYLIDPFESVLSGGRETTEFIRRMETVGYNIDLYTDRSTRVPWSEYPAVILPSSAALAPEFVAQIVRYVQGGGRLILTSATGEYTPGEAQQKFTLLKALGCDVSHLKKRVSIGRPRVVFQEEVPGKAAEVELSRLSPMPELPHEAKIWALDASKTPAVVSWPVGRGEVLMWAGWPLLTPEPDSPKVVYGKGGSSATAKTVYPTVFDRVLTRFTGVGLPLVCETPDVLFALRKKERDYFLIAFNNSSRRAQAQFKLPLPNGTYQVLNLVSLESAEKCTAENNLAKVSIDLAPLEVAVLQISPKSIEVPVLDFPRRARTVPPPGAAWQGESLRQLKVSSGSWTTAGLLNSGRDVSFSEGTEVKIPLTASGHFNLRLKVPVGEPPLQLSKEGKPLPVLAKESATGTEYSLVLNAANQTEGLVFSQKSRLEWIDAEPILVGLGDASVSPAQENPGPFPGKLFKESGPIENAILSEGMLPSNVEWKKVKPDADGTIDLEKVSGSRSGLAYVVWTVEMPEARKVLLGLGADYGLRLWLNGKLIFDSTATRREGAPVPNEFLVPVEFQEGKNILLAKVAAGAEGWTLQVNSNK
jgi:hypothetical protein